MSDIILETLDRSPDIAVSVVEPGGSARSVVEATQADVAILRGSPDGLPPLGYELLCRRPSMNVLTIRGDGRDAVLYQLRPVERALGELSPDALLEAVREIASEES